MIYCPECEREARVRCTSLTQRWYWIECPRCGKRTRMKRKRSDAIEAWENGDTYVPEKDPAQDDEYAELRKQRVIRKW